MRVTDLNPHKKVFQNWRINKLLLPHNHYSGAKHITLFSQRPFHYIVLTGALFCDQTNIVLCELSKNYRCSREPRFSTMNQFIFDYVNIHFLVLCNLIQVFVPFQKWQLWSISEKISFIDRREKAKAIGLE